MVFTQQTPLNPVWYEIHIFLEFLFLSVTLRVNISVYPQKFLFQVKINVSILLFNVLAETATVVICMRCKLKPY